MYSANIPYWVDRTDVFFVPYTLLVLLSLSNLVTTSNLLFRFLGKAIMLKVVQFAIFCIKSAISSLSTPLIKAWILFLLKIWTGKLLSAAIPTIARNTCTCIQFLCVSMCIWLNLFECSARFKMSMALLLHRLSIPLR